MHELAKQGWILSFKSVTVQLRLLETTITATDHRWKWEVKIS